MEWRTEVGPARAGDAAARERLREYFTPFAHGVALAIAPHHVAERLVARALDEALKTLGGVDDDAVGVHVMHVARRLAKEASPGPAEEQHSTNPALLEARQTLARLRLVPEQARERLFLRLVEGIPGPELAQVARLPQGELRAELERSLAEAARAFGQAQSFAGDDYLWELVGEPPALLARLEMQLPVLRFDPTAAPTPDLATSHGTFLELKPVAPASKKPGLFDEFEGTETNVVTVPAPAVVRPPLDQPNPFDKGVRTIAATDLPAEAKGQVPQVPWVEPSASQKVASLPARPVPAPGEGERSGKSISGRSRQPESSKSGRQAPMPPRTEVTKDAPKLDEAPPTMAQIPALVLARQAEVITTPESDMLGRPTMEMPLTAAISPARPNPLPNQETRVGIASVSVPAPVPSLTDATVLKGSQPLFVAVLLGLVAVIVYSVSLFAAERQARSNWQLTQVVVAAEDLLVGDTVTLENVALRAVPEPYQGSGVVKGDAMNFILDQKLAVDVQQGDPLFYTQFVSMRVKDMRLSKRVQKRTRGYTIATGVTSSVGRRVRPSDLVDVIVTFPMRDRAKKSVQRRAITLLQKVPVLATGKIADALGEATLDEREKAYNEVTLLLTPEEAEALTLASQLGHLKLTLRNEDDLEEDRDLSGAFTDSDTLLDKARHRKVNARRQEIIKLLNRPRPVPSR